MFVWVGHHEAARSRHAQASVEAVGLRRSVPVSRTDQGHGSVFRRRRCLPDDSREDPFPYVVLQALDTGFQSSDSRAPAVSSSSSSGAVVVLVPLADTRAMADAVLRVLESPEEVEQLAQCGREILAREFSFVNYAARSSSSSEPAGQRCRSVVPSYNYAKYLPARLQSIINQTYPPHEVIFLDDCSTDNSVEIAAEILHASGLSYRIITNESNQGTYRQWLRGFREAKGDLIWIAEADDDCAPDLLERLIAQFEQPDVMLAYCQSRQIDEEGRELAPDYLAYTADISETKWRACVRAARGRRDP